MTRLVTVTVVVVLGVTACSSSEDDSVRAGNTGSPVAPTTADQRERDDGDDRSATLDVAVAVDPDPPVSGASVVWTITVTNSGNEPVDRTIPSGRKADLTLRAGGETVYEWSEGRAFTQALEQEEIGAGESVDYLLDEAELDVDPGPYTMVVTVVGTPAPAPLEQEIEVVEG